MNDRVARTSFHLEAIRLSEIEREVLSVHLEDVLPLNGTEANYG
jgi:hypothetical protein